jgi:cytochrome P450
MAVVSVSAIGFMISRLASDPLRHIPGPFFASLSAAPLFLQSVQGNRANWIMRQHQKYGPVIRIAPDKVCVSSDEGVKLIYSNKASKSHAYDTFKFRDVKMCIGLRHVKQAHARRKALLPAFLRQNLLEMELVIRRHLERFLSWLEKFDTSNTPVETFQWSRYLTFDVITDVAFGQQIGMLTTKDSHFTKQIELRNKRNGLVSPLSTNVANGY